MSEEQARAVYRFIEVHPGRSAYQVARALGMTEGAVYNALAATEKMGLYLCEERGRLYIWKEECEK